ncbi:glutamine amidotransferase [Vibrio nitrifigilis]|uniref:glutamine amidotransferase n=1 Tax=Vibrio nitrifigilis TaxID=2789781 RepID=UPI001E65595A|nr:glutamine amidotransferase [Vibrio nitrifigilis]
MNTSVKTHNKPIIIETGSAPEVIKSRFLSLADWFYQALGLAESDVEIIRVYLDEPLPEPSKDRLVVITGSWAMVTDHEPWSERTAEWIKKAVDAEMPLYGVCYGHQLMSYALGGEVDYFPKQKEIGCLPVTLNETAQQDPLLSHLPTQFKAHLTHSQRVTVVPEGAQVLAGSERDGHQIIRYSPTALSTQFHPEFTPELLQAVIETNQHKLEQEGQDIPTLLAGLEEAEYARSILAKFVDYYS